MTPRETAEKTELELGLDYFARRAFTLAGDAAELKAELIVALARIAELVPPPEWEDSVGGINS